MKKIISALLILTMIFSVVSVSASAAGITYIDCDFSSIDTFTKQFIAGAFYIEDGLLFGYGEARALQSNYVANPNTYQWLTYDASITLSLSDDELREDDRMVTLVYCNDNLYEYGRAVGRVFMALGFDVTNKNLTLSASGLGDYGDEAAGIMGPVDYDIDTDSGDYFFTMGISIEKGRMRCFIDDELIFDFKDVANDWLIAECAPSCFLLFQGGNFLQISNITITEHGVLYPPTVDVPVEDPATSESVTSEEEPVVSEDVNTDETSTDPKEPVVSDSEPVVTDDAPATSDDVTTDEIPATSDDEPDASVNTNGTAATNQNKPQGGNSATTGDVSFVVVAAMVAALGCALIVKKVSAE